MARQRSPRWRHAANPAAFSALLLVVLVLGYLALTQVMDRQPETGSVDATQELKPGIEFDRFSARRERSGEKGERLSVSFRIRSTLLEPVGCFLFMVARNDHVAPRLWAIWPPGAEGAAISSGGHFHGANPSSGEARALHEDWQYVTAVLPHEGESPPYDTLVVYLVSPQGQILLSRPFAL